MNENLINDFVNKVNELDEIKTIDQDPEQIKFFSPTIGNLELDVSTLRNVDPFGLQQIANQYEMSVLNLNKFIYDITTCDKTPDEYHKEVEDVYSRIQEQAEGIGLATKYDPDRYNTTAYYNTSRDATVLSMCYDLKFYMEATINHIAETFGIFPDLDEFMTPAEEQSDDSDEKFADMLAAELVGATSGVPFTDEELYGNEVDDNE